ncbi:hypothetical protein LTR17_015800 [Elasticomyces elasticus]|nr:hypothetical protein LTR17_015800 [Elasticomyces elasticus]
MADCSHAIASDPESMAKHTIEGGYLLKLPAELRNFIYELVVRSDKFIDLISLPQSASCFKDWHVDCTYPAITLAPNQVGREALSVYFGVNRFVADVRWAATSEHNGITWGISGILGLANAFQRIGTQNCHNITELQIRWGWDRKGESSLSAMVAWASLWARRCKGKRCLPKATALKHNFTANERFTREGPFATSDSLDFDDHLYDDLPPRPEPKLKKSKIIARCKSLRKQLQNLGTRYRKTEAENMLEGYSLEMRIVQWVMERWDADHTDLKGYIRSQWLATSRWQEGFPLLKLTKELRVRIYKLALDCDEAHPTKHHILLQNTGASSRHSRRNGDSYGVYDYDWISRPRELLLHSFPPLLQLTSWVSVEAMEVYFQHHVFMTSLEFTNVGINSLRDYAYEIGTLLDKHAICVELHVEWLWSRELTLPTFVQYLRFIHEYRTKAYLKLTRVPAPTRILGRVLAQLLDTLEDVSRKRGREFGSPRQQVLGVMTADEAFFCNSWMSASWYGDCLLDWVESASEESPTHREEEEAKVVCRELFRQELEDRKTQWNNVKMYSEFIAAQSRLTTVLPRSPLLLRSCKIFSPIKDEVQQPAASADWYIENLRPDQVVVLPGERGDGEASSSTYHIDQRVTGNSLIENLAALALADETSAGDAEFALHETTEDAALCECPPTHDPLDCFFDELGHPVPTLPIAPIMEFDRPTRHPQWGWDVYPYEGHKGKSKTMEFW